MNIIEAIKILDKNPDISIYRADGIYLTYEGHNKNNERITINGIFGLTVKDFLSDWGIR